ncbi:MAG: 6-carboxytetrahydropterin synthase QueD [Acidobacteriota bacterium]
MLRAPGLFLTRRYRLSALHQLGGSGFSPEEDRRVFGACSRLHGHEYILEISVTGSPAQETGLLVKREELDNVVRRAILDRFQGRNLSDHFPHTTGEALAREFFQLLAASLPGNLRLVAVKVRETSKNFFIARPARQRRHMESGGVTS